MSTTSKSQNNFSETIDKIMMKSAIGENNHLEVGIKFLYKNIQNTEMSKLGHTLLNIQTSFKPLKPLHLCLSFVCPSLSYSLSFVCPSLSLTAVSLILTIMTIHYLPRNSSCQVSDTLQKSCCWNVKITYCQSRHRCETISIPLKMAWPWYL